MTSNVDRLFGGLADWIAEMRLVDPKTRIPLCRIQYAVSAPYGQPFLHTFVVLVVGRFPIARGGGSTIDEAARACWIELMGLKRDGLRGAIQAVLDAAGEDGVIIPSEDRNPLVVPVTKREPHRGGGGNGNGDAQKTVRTRVPAKARRN